MARKTEVLINRRSQRRSHPRNKAPKPLSPTLMDELREMRDASESAIRRQLRDSKRPIWPERIN